MADTVKHLSVTTREKISLAKTKYTKDHLINAGVAYIDRITTAEPEDKLVPSIVGYCLEAGISRTRLWELSQQWDEVANIVEYIGMLQEELALSGGLTGRTNSVFSMFLLKSKHNYQDTQQQLTQNNTFNISPDLLADALAIMKETATKKTATDKE